MAEDSIVSMSGQTSRFSLGRALIAGLVATVIITISMALFGMNIMKSLGSMILPASGTSTQYLLGGLIHLMVGVGYGVLYALLVAPVRRWAAVMKGLVYGLSITAIALAAMPVMASMMSKGGTSNPCAMQAGTNNPCNPCSGKAADTEQSNPCNPYGAKSPQTTPDNPCAGKKANDPNTQSKASNPCNPCAKSDAKSASAQTLPPNPCNPCSTKPANVADGSARSASKSGTNPCNVAAAGNPCNPCGGGGAGSPYSGLISLINHVIYALALAFVYGRGGGSPA